MYKTRGAHFSQIHLRHCSALTLQNMLYIPGIIHFAQVDELYAPSPRNLLRITLIRQSLEGCFDGIHRVSGTSDSGSHVRDARAFAHFVYLCLASDAEAWGLVSCFGSASKREGDIYLAAW